MASLLNYSHQSNSSTIKCHCTLKTKAALVGSSHCLGLLSKLLGSVSYSRSAFPFRSNANLIRLYLSPLFRCRRTNCYYYRFIALLAMCVCGVNACSAAVAFTYSSSFFLFKSVLQPTKKNNMQWLTDRSNVSCFFFSMGEFQSKQQKNFE